MADTFNFSLVSPARELFSGSVEQVDIPGTEGDLGILPDHAPLMAAIRTGVMTVTAGGAQTRYLVEGGFADVTPAGLTVLAEKAALLSDVTAAELDAGIAELEETAPSMEGDLGVTARQNLEGLRAAKATL